MCLFLSFFIRILYNNVSYRIELDWDELTGERLILVVSFRSNPPIHSSTVYLIGWSSKSSLIICPISRLAVPENTKSATETKFRIFQYTFLVA